MASNHEGGLKAAASNKARWGEDFYQRIGAKGGSAGRGPNCLKGFAANPELARKFGGIGGRKSSRKGVKNGCGKNAVKDIEAAEKILAHELEHEGGR